jgi:phage tail-like protein
MALSLGKIASKAVKISKDIGQGLISQIPPLPAYRFSVFISAGLVPLATDIRFQSVGNLDIERDVKWENNQPFLAKNEAIKKLSLKRGLVFSGDGKPSMLSASNMAQMAYWDERLLRCDLMICSIDSLGLPKAAWQIENAVLRKIDWGTLEASRNDVIIEEMSFDYSYIRPFTL